MDCPTLLKARQLAAIEHSKHVEFVRRALVSYNLAEVDKAKHELTADALATAIIALEHRTSTSAGIMLRIRLALLRYDARRALSALIKAREKASRRFHVYTQRMQALQVAAHTYAKAKQAVKAAGCEGPLIPPAAFFADRNE